MKMMLLMSVLGAGLVAGALPWEKKDVDAYSGLWEESPFTSKRGPGEVVPEVSLLDDYVLGGVSRLPEGYFVVLRHKTQRGERIVISPGNEGGHGLRVEKVFQDPGDVMATQVTVSVRGGESTVMRYDREVIARLTPKRAVQLKRAKPIVMPHGAPRSRKVPEK